MSNKTRKHIWPVSLAAVLGVAVLLAMATIVWSPGPAQAQGGGPPNPFAPTTPTPTGGPSNPFVTPTPTPAAPVDPVVSSSTSGSATVELKLTVTVPSGGVPVGGAFVLYLEDDFQEPESISAGDVYFVSTPSKVTTGSGSRVYATVNPEVDTNDHFTADKDDIDIRVSVPDMCTTDTPTCQGANGLMAGDTVTMVIQKSAGIKNPSEAGSHSTGYAIIGPTANVPNGPSGTGFMKANELSTVAKIRLSDVDNSRGYEMTVTGSGFNNGTSAAVYVLAASEEPTCETIIRTGTKVGGALVGSDDKVTVTFEVTAPTFQPGNVNYICMVDGEGRMSDTDVEDFKLEPSIKVVPGDVATGDTVNVFAQDFQNNGQAWTGLKLGGQTIAPNGAALSTFVQNSRSIGTDGSGEVTFEVPGGLEGVLRIDAIWGDTNGNNKCDTGESTCVSEDSKITITGSELNPSKTDVLPNETLTVTGNGFGTQTCIAKSNITLDDVPLIIHDDSLSDVCGGQGVLVSNSGQFVATIILWPVAGQTTNPTLIPGTHELSVEDGKKFSSSVNLTIAEPTIMVTPDVAGPRDYITITGENWPVDNLDNSLGDQVEVLVSDFQNGRSYSLYADAIGRFTQEHRIHRKVAIPDTVQVKGTFGDVAKIGSFAVPASTVEVTPSEAQPGDSLSLSAGNMPVYTKVEYVEVGGTRQIHEGVNTDRDGNVQVDDVLVPGLDPGTYSVVVAVGERDNPTIAIGEVTVLAESSAAGAPAELPGATEELGDNLIAIFHFDDVGKVWAFYDPRPEFAELNTLTEMVNGEAYWILVNETVEDVVLNNKVRSLTCRGDDCWNLEVW